MNEHAATAAPGRLDQFWADLLDEGHVTRAKVQEAIRLGLALVDGVAVRKPGHKLRGGERLSLSLPEVACAPKAQAGGLTVVYRDERLVVVDKPPGLTVHPAPSCPEGTLVNLLLHHFPELALVGGERPGIVHRIDKDTSGLLVVALSEPVRQRLSAAFAGREVRKTYLALLHGRPERDEGRVEAPIGRDPSHKTRMAVVKGGREALSFYRVVWTAPGAGACLVEVDIATGRTHQIRVHMEHVGHPLLGDRLYGQAAQAGLKRRDPLLHRLAARQMLHAWKLSLERPAAQGGALSPVGREAGEDRDGGRTAPGHSRDDACDCSPPSPSRLEESDRDGPGPLSFTCPPPRDFWRILLHLNRPRQRVGLVGLPGSGKSAVLAMLRQRGLPTWSADACVAELYQPGNDGWHMLRSRFGERFTPSDKAPVDKAALLAAMRSSESFRRELMELLYPLVASRLAAFFAANARARAAFAEAPMLLEAGWLARGAVDFCLGVDCRREVRHARLADTRGWDQATADLFDSWQWSAEKKMAACAKVLDNSGPLERTARHLDLTLEAVRRQRMEQVRNFLRTLRSNGYA